MRSVPFNLERYSKRFLVLYVALVAVPASVFVYLGSKAVLREWEYLKTKFDTSSTQEAGKRTAQKVEDAGVNLALAFFDDPALADYIQRQVNTPSDCVSVREGLLQAKTRNRFVAEPFVVCNGTVTYPALRAPVPVRERDYVKNDPYAKSVLLNLRRGDGYRGAHDLRQALLAYNRAYDTASSQNVKALLLLRIARCLSDMKLAEAKGAFDKVGSVYGDILDPNGVPFAITAAMLRPDGTEELKRTRNDLANGRWASLSGEQTSELLKRFETRLGPLPASESTPFLRLAAMAKALQSAMKGRRDLYRTPISTDVGGQAKRDSAVFSLNFGTSEHTYPAFFAVARGKRGGEMLFGFTADMDWFQTKVLPEYLGYRFDISYKGSSAPQSTRIAFDRIFTHWELVPASSLTRERATFLDIFTIAGTAVLLCLMFAGIYVLLRQLANEHRMVRMRNDFVTGVSHELKTPISVMRLYAETLTEDDSLKDETRDYCHVISEEAERLTHLIDGILDFSPVDRGIKRYAMTQGDLTDVIRPALSTCQAYLERKGVTLSAYLSSSLPEVEFDAEAVKSAVINLIDNAVKYSGSSKTIQISSYHDDDNVVIAVTDHGIGIPENEQQRIFEPFYRVDVGFSRGGCGLGLYLVRQFMEAHHGRIEVTSQVGKGSCFRLIFPRKAKEISEATGDLAATA